MSTPDVDALADGAAATGASLQTPLGSLEDAVNDLEADAVADGAFRHFHLPSLVPLGDTVTVDAAGAGHNYDAAAWVAVTDGGGNECKLLFSALTLGTGAGTDNVAVVLILGNCHLWDIRDAADPDNRVDPGHIAGLRLEWFDGTSWHEVDQGLAVWAQDTVNLEINVAVIDLGGESLPRQQVDLPLLGVLTSADTGGADVSGVRITARCLSGASAWWGAGDEQMTLKECTLNVLGVFCGGT